MIKALKVMLIQTERTKMNKITKKSALAIGVLASSALCGTALMAPNTFADTLASGAFSDQNFLECVVGQYNALHPDDVTTKETMTVPQVESLEVLNCNYGEQQYTDLPSYYTATAKITNTRGIEHMKDLKTLYMSGHSFSSIDLHLHTKLRALSIGTNNNLTSLDLHNSKKLQTANVGGANLSTLNLEGLTELTWLQASHNNLSTIDLSTNTGLQSLELVDNKLTKIDVSKSPKLATLFADPTTVITPYTEFGQTDQCELTASLKFVGVYNTIVKTNDYSFNNDTHILTMAKRPAGNGVDAIEVMSKYAERSATYRISFGEPLVTEFAKLDKCVPKKADEGSDVKVPDTGINSSEDASAHIIEASILGLATVAALGFIGSYIHNRRRNHIKF